MSRRYWPEISPVPSQKARRGAPPISSMQMQQPVMLSPRRLGPPAQHVKSSRVGVKVWSTTMLFDEFERTETRAKRGRESLFAYLNLSARAPIAAARQVLQHWFDSYPESGKADLLARFRSPIDSQDKSAFWELYIYELFSRPGFTLEAHPNIEGSANHPDFLVKEGDVPTFYLEAIVAGIPSVK